MATAIAATLAWAAGGKLLDLTGTTRFVQAVGLSDAAQAQVIAAVVPIVEIGVALMILCANRRLNVAGCAVGIPLAASFATIHGFMVFAGEEIPCGCLGMTVTFGSRGSHSVMAGLSVTMLAGMYYVLLSATPRSPLGDA